jgi:hypothetical protein
MAVLRSDRPLPPATFEQWVTWVFDHPAGKPEWHWTDRTPRPTRGDALPYMIELFEAPEGPLRAFSDAQLNQGLWFLASNSCSEHFYAFTDLRLPEEQRLRGVRAIGTLYARLFAKRCSPHLGHLGEPGAGALNSVCHMLWDIAPLPRSRDQASLAAVNIAAIDVMEACLALDHDACRESALHGLGESHWFVPTRQRVQAAVDAFLARSAGLRSELVAYAERARAGHVL